MEASDQVDARGAMLARIAGTFVDLRLAVLTRVASHTLTQRPVRALVIVHARTVVTVHASAPV